MRAPILSALVLATALPAFANEGVRQGESHPGPKFVRVSIPSLDDQRAAREASNGAKFLRAVVTPPPFAAGDTLPKGYMVLLNTEYYGLPRAGDGWMYYRVEDHVFRVRNADRLVLEDVTGQLNRAFQ